MNNIYHNMKSVFLDEGNQHRGNINRKIVNIYENITVLKNPYIISVSKTEDYVVDNFNFLDKIINLYVSFLTGLWWTIFC